MSGSAEIYAYEIVSIWDFYNDDNNGFIYGVQGGTYLCDGTPIDIEPQWFKTKKERDDEIELLKNLGYLDVSDLKIKFSA